MSAPHPRLPAELVLSAAERRRLRDHRPYRNAVQSVLIVASYGALAAGGAVIGQWWAWAVAWWFQGFILSGFLGAAHDCAHGTFARTRRANHVAGALWASVVLFNFTLYRYYHIEHHRHTSVEGDTEPPGMFHTVGDYFRNLPTTAFFVSFWRMSADAERGRYPHFIRTARARKAVRVDNRVLLGWLVLTVVATVLWPGPAVRFYWAPLMVYFPMVFLTSLPEHYGCDVGPDVRRNVRSMAANPLFRLFFWNGNYHAEHHLHPWVPSYHLHRLHGLIGHHFAFRETSYVGFHARLVWGLLRGDSPSSAKRLQPLKRVTYTTYANGAEGPGECIPTGRKP
jgi:fatty acid desaturase